MERKTRIWLPFFNRIWKKQLFFFCILFCHVLWVEWNFCVWQLFIVVKRLFFWLQCITHKDWSVFSQIDLNFCFTKIETSCCQLEMKLKINFWPRTSSQNVIYEIDQFKWSHWFLIRFFKWQHNFKNSINLMQCWPIFTNLYDPNYLVHTNIS